MFGKPVLINKKQNPIIRRPHWQYNIKRDGTRRARLCCNGSNYAAPILHALAITYILLAWNTRYRDYSSPWLQDTTRKYMEETPKMHIHTPQDQISQHI